jgi:hypothetical protein
MIRCIARRRGLYFSRGWALRKVFGAENLHSEEEGVVLWPILEPKGKDQTSRHLAA